MKKLWYGIVGGIIILLLIGIILQDQKTEEGKVPKESSTFNKGEITAIKEAANYEINEFWQSLEAEPICYEYLWEEPWLRLRCDPTLTKAGMQLIVERIKEYISPRVQGPLKVNVAFKDRDYKTLEIFEIEIE